MARVAIVGAGPAGSSAAWHLASRGHDVTLIDRAAFPRPKTCGDFITIRAVSELERLGLARESIERLATERASIAFTRLAAPNGRATDVAGGGVAYCIPRLVFDAILWRHAVEAGCRPMRRSVREIGADDGAFLLDWDDVIDARGAHAGTPNGVALRAYWTVPRHALAPEDDSTVQIHTDAEVQRGYGWIFPVHADATGVRFNVGVGLWAADSRPGADVRDFYERFISTNRVVRAWGTAATHARPIGCHVGLGLGPNVVGHHALRIGDAANLADPLTGDGIGHALLSGRLVADAISSSADRAGAAVRWQALHDHELVPELQRALLLRRGLTTTPAKNLAAAILASVPALRARIHSAFFGERMYGEMWRGRR